MGNDMERDITNWIVIQWVHRAIQGFPQQKGSVLGKKN